MFASIDQSDGSVYTYGGTWRCDWLREYFDAADASGGVSLETFIGVPARADRGSALNRGGGGQTDRAAREILLPFWLPLLPAAGGGEPYATVLELLSGFDGGAWPEENNGEDVADDYLLAVRMIRTYIQVLAKQPILSTQPTLG